MTKTHHEGFILMLAIIQLFVLSLMMLVVLDDFETIETLLERMIQYASH